MIQYEPWIDEELASLKAINSFHDMVPIGVRVLRRIRQHGEKVVQICGPMSTGGKGTLAANMTHFKRAVAHARLKGVLVFDQTPFEDPIIRLSASAPREGYCHDILHIFYRSLFESRLITTLSFLPDWQSSVGAKWEYEEALRLGIEIEDYPCQWLEELAVGQPL